MAWEQKLLLTDESRALPGDMCPAAEFYCEGHDHRQYLATVPNGCAGLGGTAVACELVKAG